MKHLGGGLAPTCEGVGIHPLLVHPRVKLPNKSCVIL